MARTPEQNNAIITGSIPRQLLLFFFPIWLGTMFQQLYNTVDTLIVGNFVGTQALAAVAMFYINLVFNFFVSSASGQAAIVMPIMTPLADVIGVTRQVAVLAYQYGDGLSNTIIPTSGVLMAALGVAGVPFSKWLKFQVPLFLIWTAICTVAIIVAVMIGYH